MEEQISDLLQENQSLRSGTTKVDDRAGRNAQETIQNLRDKLEKSEAEVKRLSEGRMGLLDELDEKDLQI